MSPEPHELVSKSTNDVLIEPKRRSNSVSLQPLLAVKSRHSGSYLFKPPVVGAALPPAVGGPVAVRVLGRLKFSGLPDFLGCTIGSCSNRCLCYVQHCMRRVILPTCSFEPYTHLVWQLQLICYHVRQVNDGAAFAWVLMRSMQGHDKTRTGAAPAAGGMLGVGAWSGKGGMSPILGLLAAGRVVLAASSGCIHWTDDAGGLGGL